MAAQDGAGERRRTRSLDERKRIVEEALTPGVSVAAVARRHGLNANLVFKWIRCSREGWLYRRREPGGQPCRGRATREGQIGLRPLELHRRSRQCSAQRKLCKPGSPLKKSDCGHQTSLQAKIQTFRRSCFFVFTREPNPASRGQLQRGTQTYDWGTNEGPPDCVKIAPGASLAPRTNSRPLITTLPERCPWRTRMAPAPHAMCMSSERSIPGKPVPVVATARKSLMFSSLFPRQTFEKAPGAGDSAWMWLRTVSALCVQSISASLFSILCA